MKTTQEMIEVMQAYADGKEIEYYEEINQVWVTAHVPTWDWRMYDYRIKSKEPKPTYRPYEYDGEMIADYSMRFDSEYCGASELPLIWVQEKKTNIKVFVSKYHV